LGIVCSFYKYRWTSPLFSIQISFIQFILSYALIKSLNIYLLLMQKEFVSLNKNRGLPWGYVCWSQCVLHFLQVKIFMISLSTVDLLSLTWSFWHHLYFNAISGLLNQVKMISPSTWQYLLLLWVVNEWLILFIYLFWNILMKTGAKIRGQVLHWFWKQICDMFCFLHVFMGSWKSCSILLTSYIHSPSLFVLLWSQSYGLIVFSNS
jgi:hypothetical protein